jgi:hypothetical protein
MKLCPKCNNIHEKQGKFCSRTCANSRTWSNEDKLKKSESVKTFWKENGHPAKGTSGWKHSEEDKEIKRKKSLQFWDKKGRKSKEHFILKNRIGVSAYRARKYNATPENVDKKLIKLIYENCPTDYEVDHIIALAEGGLHEPNNLQYLPAIENRKKNKSQDYNKNLAIDWKDYIK